MGEIQANFDTKRYKISNLKEEEITEIKEVFDLFDTNKTGFLNVQELKETINNLKKENNSLKRVIKKFEKKGLQEVNFEQFITVIVSIFGNNNTRKGIKKTFKLFDYENKGYISFENLKRVAKELEENMTDQELLEMFQRADINKENKIRFDSFYNLMAGNSSQNQTDKNEQKLIEQSQKKQQLESNQNSQNYQNMNLTLNKQSLAQINNCQQSQKQTFNCKYCFEKYDMEEVITLNCEHRIDQNCLKSIINTAFNQCLFQQSDYQCPECHQPLEMPIPGTTQINHELLRFQMTEQQ